MTPRGRCVWNTDVYTTAKVYQSSEKEGMGPLINGTRKIEKNKNKNKNKNKINSMVLAQRQKYRSREQNRKPRDKSTHLWTPYI